MPFESARINPLLDISGLHQYSPLLLQDHELDLRKLWNVYALKIEY